MAGGLNQISGYSNFFFFIPNILSGGHDGSIVQ